MFRNTSIFFVALLVAAAPAPAQDEVREDPARALIRAALGARNTYAMLTDLCRTAPHRLSGSPGAAAAVEWARQAMKDAGLENVRLEPCTVPHWVRGDVEVLKIVGPTSAAGELPILALGGSVATPETGITAEVIAVRSFEELAERAAEARGKIVLFNRPMDGTLVSQGAAYGAAVEQRVRGASEAAKVGAVAAVVRSMTPDLDDVPHTGGRGREDPHGGGQHEGRGADRGAPRRRQGGLPPPPARLPVAPGRAVVQRGRRARGEEPAGRDRRGRCAPRRLGRGAGSARRRRGLLPGDRGGAADEGAGAAAAADDPGRALHERGERPPRRKGVREGGPEALAILREIAEPLKEIGAADVFPGGGGADIGPMAKSGVVLVGYLPDTQRYFSYHHAETDTIEKVSWRELELGTAAIATLIHGVANRETALPRN
jgi:hypothetical protein